MSVGQYTAVAAMHRHCRARAFRAIGRLLKGEVRLSELMAKSDWRKKAIEERLLGVLGAGANGNGSGK
jgi:hypothetical protein